MSPEDKSAQPERGERLNRYLARSGIGSRRRADDLIAAGRVRLNGETVQQMATFVRPGIDRVAVDGKAIEPPPDIAIWLALHKLSGCVTTRSDELGRMTVYDGLPPVYAQLICVGRLDRDTTGLLLLTNDGEAASRLMHPRYQVERVYEATVVGVPTRGTIRKMRDGVDLGDPTPARAEAEVIGHHMKGALLKMVLREGRKREIKRMCEELGHPVLRLSRRSYAGIGLHRLEPGKWRKLNADEIDRIRQTVAMPKLRGL